MKRQIGLALAVALKLLAIALALVLDRDATGLPAVVLLPIMALLVGIALGRGNRRLAALVAGASGTVNAVGFPIVLLLIHHWRFGGPPDVEGLTALFGLLAIGGLLVSPAAAWLLVRKRAERSQIVA